MATKGKTPKKTAKKTKKKPASKRVKKEEVVRNSKGEIVTHAGAKNLIKGRKPNFKKGESGNPSGRIKGSKNRATILRELLGLTLKDRLGRNVKNPLDPSEKKMTVEKAINAALIKKALSGDIRAIQEVQDTVYGKIKDKMELSERPTVIRDDIQDGG